jgi:hypothetical protein
MNLLDRPALHLSIKDAVKALPRGQKEGEVIVGVGDSGEQRIKIICIPSNLKGLINFFICPVCGNKTRKLFMTYDKDSFLCRQCCGIKYRTQTDYKLRKTSYQKKGKPVKEPGPTIEETKRMLEEFMSKRGLA